MYFLGILKPNLAIGFVGGTLIVATVGWIDDLRRLSVRVRLGAHFFAATWALMWIGGYTVLHFGSGQVELGGFGFALAAVGITWGTNFFNFMDGIDGIVAAEAVCFTLVAGALLGFFSQPPAIGVATVALLIAGASAGFLCWNWAPAKVFLGDTGSTVLGFLICTLAVASENLARIPMLTWGTLLAVFVYDPTVTVIRRIALGFDWECPSRVRLPPGRPARVVALTGGRAGAAAVALNVILACTALVGLEFPGLLPATVASKRGC